MAIQHLLALPLEAAIEILQAQETEFLVARTAPPFHPRGYTPFWGAERVVRVRELGENRVELCVARELIGEERAGKGAASG